MKGAGLGPSTYEAVTVNPLVAVLQLQDVIVPLATRLPSAS
jgi:hypothetical protein